MNLKTLLDHLSHLPQGLGGVKIALQGPLGAGKTHLVKALAERLLPGLGDDVQSPSFNLCHEYAAPGLVIQHYDLYRIESANELEELGIYESLSDEHSLCLIEWADLFAEIRRLCHYAIEIRLLPDQSRDYFVFALDQKSQLDLDCTVQQVDIKAK